MHIEPVPNTFTNLLSPIPPWKDINEMFLTGFLPQLGVEHMTNAQANARFTDLIHSKFSNYFTIFTDGSKATMPETSVSAAVAIPNVHFVQHWKLSTSITILGAELYHIKKALLYIRSNKQNFSNVVIFTDSLVLYIYFWTDLHQLLYLLCMICRELSMIYYLMFV